MSAELHAATRIVSEEARLAARTERWRDLGPQDLIVTVYLLGLNFAVWRVPPSPERSLGELQVGSLLFIMLSMLLLVRGRVLRPSLFSALYYRVAVYGTVQISYFLFHSLLPLVNPTALDRELYALDMDWFGIEPALALDAWVGPFTTEWFAFFYFSYFFILALHVIPILFFGRDPRVLADFALGMLIMFCLGHTVYMLVPGFGPFRAMASEFTKPFPSGLWLDIVHSTVARGGAQKDIFPSLHTAAPLFVALLAYRYRDRIPFRYTWMPLCFFSANVIVATMFLRWHYVIDVVAGLALATCAALVAPRIMRWELKRREREDLSPLWPALFRD